MKFCILTTDTDHHTYFINKIQEKFDISFIVYETSRLEFPYDTRSAFERSEKLFEKNFFFKGCPSIKQFKAPIFSVPSINNLEFKEFLEHNQVDFAIVFGCGRIKTHIIDLFPEGMINIHRGISRKYRGLDSDLWAAYNNDFNNIGITLHYIEKGLDTGPIVFEGAIKIHASCKIYELRAHTTLLATEKILDFLDKKCKKIQVQASPQLPGKYYSAMAAQKKIVAESNFNHYVRTKSWKLQYD